MNITKKGGYLVVEIPKNKASTSNNVDKTILKKVRKSFFLKIGNQTV